MAMATPFTPEQLRYLAENFAAKPHTHPASEVIADPSDRETQESFNDRVSEALEALTVDEEETEEEEDEEE